MVLPTQRRILGAVKRATIGSPSPECVNRMIQLPQYLLWIGATLLAGYVAVLGWKLGVSRHFPFLTTYLVLSLIAELSRWVILTRWGVVEYMSVYYISELPVAVALYLASDFWAGALWQLTAFGRSSRTPNLEIQTRSGRCFVLMTFNNLVACESGADFSALGHHLCS